MAIDLYFLFASSVAAVVARLVTHPSKTLHVHIYFAHTIPNASPS